MIVHFVRYANITGLVTVSEYCFLAADFPLPFFFTSFFLAKREILHCNFCVHRFSTHFSTNFFFPLLYFISSLILFAVNCHQRLAVGSRNPHISVKNGQGDCTWCY